MFGGSAIERELFETIRDIVPDGGSLLEFGSGDGTSELLKHYRVTSIEHNVKYLERRDGEHVIFHAPLRNGWYDRKVVKQVLGRSDFDFILIDGPPGKTRDNINIDLFDNIVCPVIFDDVNRDIDRDAMIRTCGKLNYDFVVFSGKSKDFAVCFKIKEN